MHSNIRFSRTINCLDYLIRFFLYALIFWIPYSPAVIESCVITSLVLFIIKRFLSANKTRDFLLPPATFLNKEIGVFVLICIAVSFFSSHRSVSFHGLFTKTLEWFIIFHLVAGSFKEKRHFLTAFIVFLVTSFAVFIDGVTQYYFLYKDIFNSQLLSDGRMTASFNHANGLAGYLTICFFAGLSWLRISKRNLWNKILPVTFMFFLLWAMIMTGSRAGWLALFAGIFYLLFTLGKKRLGLILLGLVVLGVLFMGKDKVFKEGTRMSLSNLSSAASWRLGLWEDSLKMIKEKPILGHGINTFMRLFQDYRRKYIGAADYSPSYAHNCYIQIAVETGILGLLSFMWIIFKFFFKLNRKIKEFPERSNSCFVILTGISCGIFAFLAHSFFDTNLYSLQLSALVWTAMGMAVAMYNNLENLTKKC
ncbi:MAG: O-antigen ligase family protein [Candidatus Omnitrophica bacterium]|nr:O-antigen ligase family protein [Candidatus Omnitrophota bacterium]